MKKFFLFFFLGVASFVCAREVSCERTYIKPCQIHLTESNLFVQFDDVLIQLGSLHTDEKGLYFDTIRVDEKRPGPWQCGKAGCYTWNEEWRDYCKQCGSPKS